MLRWTVLYSTVFVVVGLSCSFTPAVHGDSNVVVEPVTQNMAFENVSRFGVTERYLSLCVPFYILFIRSNYVPTLHLESFLNVSRWFFNAMTAPCRALWLHPNSYFVA